MAIYSPVFLLEAFKYLKVFLIYLLIFYYISMFLFGDVLMVTYALQCAQGGQRTTCRNCSLPLLRGSQGSHSGHQVWPKFSLHIEPPHRPRPSNWHILLSLSCLKPLVRRIWNRSQFALVVVVVVVMWDIQLSFWKQFLFIPWKPCWKPADLVNTSSV